KSRRRFGHGAYGARQICHASARRKTHSMSAAGTSSDETMSRRLRSARSIALTFPECEPSRIRCRDNRHDVAAAHTVYSDAKD
ncbi:MAG: hypothetical protein AAF865_17175, partial [Pseudomonadota bacterium]